MTLLLSKLKSGSKNLWNNSQTKVWSKVQAVSGATIAAVGSFHPWITDPTVKNYIAQLHISPEIGAGIAGFGLISYICHGHKDD